MGKAYEIIRNTIFNIHLITMLLHLHPQLKIIFFRAITRNIANVILVVFLTK